MQLPIVKPAPVVVAHAGAFASVFENKQQRRHFENYLTGLMVLSNKSMTNISRCILNSADKTNVSRFLSEAPWLQEGLNDCRLEYMLQQTCPHRLDAKHSYLLIDDTLCEHVGNLFEYVSRHYDHADNTYPLAHNLVTSHYVSGAVRFPVDVRTYRRYEEVTRWEEFVKKQFPDKEIPTASKKRQALHKQVDPILLRDPEFMALHEQFQTKISLAKELIKRAVERTLPFKMVLMDGWYLTDEVVALLQEHQIDWISILKKNRNLEVASFTLKDENGEAIALTGPHIQVQELVKLIPKNAYKKVTVQDKEYWCFSLNVRVPGLGKVRLIISHDTVSHDTVSHDTVSHDKEDLKGTYVVLCSNRTDWSAKKIIETYLQRWPIETFYQDSKGHLGLDEYRMRTAQAFQKHWCLVFVAYSLLHLECLPALQVEGKRLLRRPCKTIGEVCREQGQAIIEALVLFAHQQLSDGLAAKDVLAGLFARQQPTLSLKC